MSATRSQLSAEFIILFAGILLVFIILFSTYFNKQQDLSIAQNVADAKEIAHELSYGINAVFLSGYDTNVSVTIPTKLSGIEDFTINIYNNSLWVLLEGGSYSYPLLTQNVSLTYSSKSQFSIYNSGQEVIVS